MRYEYNGNLEIEDRIDEVCSDIRSEYKDIPLEKLKKIAVLESPITYPVNSKIKFKRLYNILLVINNNVNLSSTYDKVLKDLVSIYNNMSKDEIDDEMEIMDNVLKFKNNSGERFCLF